MKHKTIFLLISICLLSVACSRLPAPIVSSAENPTAIDKNQSISKHTLDTNQNSNKFSSILKTDKKLSIVLNGNITNQDLIKGENEFSNFAVLEGKSLDKAGVSFEADVINCGGYLFSAVVNKYFDKKWKEDVWQYKIISQTVAADALQKIKQCNESPKSDTEDLLSSEALMIAPRESNRQSIKTKAINTKKIFSSLPKDVQNWLNQIVNECCERKEKSNLSLQEQDAWFDTNGDNKIDWLKITGVDKENLERKGQNYSVSRMFKLEKGKWREIKIPESE